MDNQDQGYFNHTEWGIGRLIDDAIRDMDTNEGKTLFADGTGVGTIKNKVAFCTEVIKFLDNANWKLTQEAETLCERIYEHIEKYNK